MPSIKVIILTLDTLKAVGLRCILERSFGIEAMVGDNNYFATLITNGEPNLFFVDTHLLMSHLNFFRPRKSKTIVWSGGFNQIEDFDLIDITSSEQEITSRLNKLLKQEEKKEEKSMTTTLSQREIEVLKLVAMGHINKEIAQELNISINTVLSHRKNLTSKLGIKSVSGLTFYAMMNGIV